MERRRFVGLTGAAAAAALSGILPRSATSLGPSEADWRALERGLGGEIVRPGQDGYDLARLTYNSLFDGVRPQAVARCRTGSDVREVLAFARRFGMPITARSGGHSYAGYSTGPGVVVDLSPLNSIEVSGDRATVGSGAKLIDVYDQLIARGICIPGGTCPTVGIAGLTLGGGIGVLGRAHGLTADCLVAARVVSADGRVLECDAQRHSDLFWALRGGGGGNFGIVTSFTFRAHRTQPVDRLHLSWNPGHAREVLSGWQAWSRALPESVWSGLVLRPGPPEGQGPTAWATVVCLDSEADRHAAGLAAAVGREPSTRTVQSTGYRELMLTMAGCDERSVSECRLKAHGPEGTLERSAYVAASDFFDHPLPPDGVDAMIRGARPGGKRIGVVILDAMGGAIGRVPSEATAFVHRSALFSAQYFTSLPRGTPAEALDEASAWQQELRKAMRPWSSGRAYQNYVDPRLGGWERAYYGRNHERLVRVKAAYDPEWVFRFPQGIPPR